MEACALTPYRCLTTREVAQQLDISPRTVRVLITHGALPAFRTPTAHGHYRISPDAFAAFEAAYGDWFTAATPAAAAGTEQATRPRPVAARPTPGPDSDQASQYRRTA